MLKAQLIHQTENSFICIFCALELTNSNLRISFGLIQITTQKTVIMKSFIAIALFAIIAAVNAGFLHSAPAIYAAPVAVPVLKATYPTYAVHSPIVASYHAAPAISYGYAAPAYGLGYAGSYGHGYGLGYAGSYGYGGHGLGYGLGYKYGK